VATAAEYQARAVDRIREIVAVEHAVVRRELESRIAEGHWAGSGENIDPHHITNAVRHLVSRNEVHWVGGTTRGGADVETLQPTDRTGRGDRIDRAAARKRLLYGRYLGWATGTIRHPKGLVGPAGEAATRSAILASGVVIPAVPGAAGVSRILNVHLSGPLDSAGYTIPLDAAGLPGEPVTLLFEVKNLRNWLYPTAPEPFQLLSKAVHVQRAQPDEAIVPILVCRKAHTTTFWMAKQLGFMVIDMERQFIGAVDEDKILEVRNELQFNDLTRGDGPSARVRDRLSGTVRTRCPEFASTWRTTALDTEVGQTILDAATARNPRERHREVGHLRDTVVERGWGEGW
jgi:hypothetical protein